MKNFVQKGDVVTVVAPAAVSSGDFVAVGSLYGVAAIDAALGAEVELALRGVFELPVAGLVQGAPVYWDATPGELTATALDNTRIGVAVADTAAGVTRVRLDG